MKAVHFGAGNIGRGFIGQVLRNSGFSLVFVDTNQEVIDQINLDQGYFIEVLDEMQTQFWIDQVSAINSNDTEKVIDELIDCDLITTSVGAGNLKYIAPVLKSAMLKRYSDGNKINVLANENVINASDILRDAIKRLCSDKEWEEITSIAYFVNTAIDRQALSKFENDRSIAVVEPYYEWVIDQTALNPNQKFQLMNVTLVQEMKPFIERKLFIVNAEHAAFAYLGRLLGFSTIQEAIRDQECCSIVRKFLDENKQYFLKSYPMSESELTHFIDKTIERHGNPAISDDVARVGRSPIRKLERYDRLVGPVMALEERGLANSFGKFIIAAAYLYENEEDVEAVQMQKMIQEMGIQDAICHISKVPPLVAQEIAGAYVQVKENLNQVFSFLEGGDETYDTRGPKK